MTPRSAPQARPRRTLASASTKPVPDAMAGEPKFMVDQMLGRVARWLVMLGYDAQFSKPDEPDEAMAERARDQGRILLTRDTRIAPFNGLRMVVLKEQGFEAQLRRV